MSEPPVVSFVWADRAGVEAGVEVAEAAPAAGLTGVEVAEGAVLAGVAGAAGLEISLGGVGGESTWVLAAGASGRAGVSPALISLEGAEVAVP